MKSYFFCRNLQSANFQQNLFLLAFPFLCSAYLTGCKEDAENPSVKLAELSINGKEVAISDSIIFIQKDDSQKEVRISPTPTDALLYYSVNNGNYELNTEGIVRLNKEDSLLQFYHSKNGFNNSQIRTILFSANSKRFLNPIKFFPNPADSVIHLEEVNNSRGEIDWSIFTMTGDKVLEGGHFKSSDSLAITFNVKEFKDGVYFFQVKYGKNNHLLKLVETRK